MPTYKRSFEYIKRAVFSVLNQSYSNLELIVIDDNPKEDIKRFNVENSIKSFEDKRIHYIQHGDNKGACAARNTGIKKARGEFITFLDDDDEWIADKTIKQLEKIINTSAGLVYSPYYVQENGRKTIRNKITTNQIYKNLLYQNFIGSTSSVMISKKCLFDVGFFIESLPASQDYDLYLRISKKHSIEVVDEPLMIYHIHEGERISGDPFKKLKAREYILDNYKDDINHFPKIKQEKHLMLAYSYSLFNMKKLKWKHWFSSFLSYPIPNKRFIKVTVKMLINRL